MRGIDLPPVEAFVTAIQSAQNTRAEIAPPVRVFQRRAEMAIVQLITISLFFLVLSTPSSRNPRWCFR